MRRVSLVDDVRAVLRIARLIRRLRPDLLVTHQSKSGAIGRTATLLCGRPPAVHVVSTAPFGPDAPRRAAPLYRAVERVLAPATSHYAAVGTDLAERLVALGIPRAKVSVVRAGVTIGGVRRPRADARAALAERFGVPADRPLVASIASVEARNGSWELPRLARAWREREPRPFLLVAGRGPLDEALRRTLCEAGLTGHSLVLGQVPDVDDVLAAADAIVLLTRDGGLPEALVLAAAAGVPFVSYDIDGARELRELGADGILVAHGDVEAAAGAVEHLLAAADRSPGHRRHTVVARCGPRRLSLGDGRRADALTPLTPACGPGRSASLRGGAAGARPPARSPRRRRGDRGSGIRSSPKPWIGPCTATPARATPWRSSTGAPTPPTPSWRSSKFTA